MTFPGMTSHSRVVSPFQWMTGCSRSQSRTDSRSQSGLQFNQGLHDVWHHQSNQFIVTEGSRHFLGPGTTHDAFTPLRPSLLSEEDWLVIMKLHRAHSFSTSVLIPSGPAASPVEASSAPLTPDGLWMSVLCCWLMVVEDGGVWINKLLISSFSFPFFHYFIFSALILFAFCYMIRLWNIQ